MAQFYIKCPKCGQELEVQDEWVGMEAECPFCHHTLKIEKKIPVLKPVFEKNEGQARESGGNANENPGENHFSNDSFLFICPECGTASELKAGMNGKSFTCPACGEDVTAVPSLTRNCPHCDEEINIKATFCKYCHKNVPPIKPQNKKIENSSNGRIYRDKIYNGTNRRNQEEYIEKLYKYFFVLGISALTLSVVRDFLMVFNDTFAESFSLRQVFAILYCIPGIPYIVFLCMLIYQYWKLIPADNALTTPGKAVGFLFIPGFNFYWGFVALWGLGKALANETGEEKPDTATWGLVYAISICTVILGLIPGIGILFSLFTTATPFFAIQAFHKQARRLL